MKKRKNIRFLAKLKPKEKIHVEFKYNKKHYELQQGV